MTVQAAIAQQFRQQSFNGCPCTITSMKNRDLNNTTTLGTLWRVTHITRCLSCTLVTNYQPIAGVDARKVRFPIPGLNLWCLMVVHD